MQKRLVILAVAMSISGGISAYANDAENLELGQLGAVNGRVKFRMSNMGPKSSDVVFWIADRGSRYCEKITSIGAKKYIDIEFQCEFITPDSRIQLGYGWSDRVPRIAAVAKRID